MTIVKENVPDKQTHKQLLYQYRCLGREGVRDQPWLGSWNDNVTVTMVTCGDVERAKDASAFRSVNLKLCIHSCCDEDE